MADQVQANRILSDKGFIAALDQSGGSTPRALLNYGIGEDAYASEEEMFGLIHAMRSRIMKSPAFDGDRIVGAILFEQTLERDVDGLPTAEYLWKNCRIVPFLKVDEGLDEEADGVRMMKPISDLDALLDRAAARGVFGTKMRSVIDSASPSGIAAIVGQQFGIARRILAHGFVPIIEPEVSILISGKAVAEDILLSELTTGLDTLDEDQRVMFKLTLPTKPNLYESLSADPRVMRVVALSGGYGRNDANRLLSLNAGVIASFSRALTEGLSIRQDNAEFDRILDDAIQSIYDASVAG